MSKRINQIEPWVGEEEKKELIETIDSGWITEAGRTAQFEKMVAEFVGVKYALAVCNGTVSLFIGLMALGIKPGDEVIVPDMTMVASANAVKLVGATPVLIDVTREDFCFDFQKVEEKITSKTRCLMPVAFNGRPPKMAVIKKIARKYKLFILEDAAQALGCYWRDKHLGTIGQIGSFSFSTPKIITTGQGGMVVTNSKRLRDKMYRVKDFGRLNRKTQDHHRLGFNFKFTDFQAAVGIAQMRKLSWRVKRKKAIYKLYYQELKDIPQIEFLETDFKKTAPWFIDIYVEKPKELAAFLNSKEIGTREFYPSLHSLRQYRTKDKFPHSTYAAKHGLWLPSSTFLTNQDIKRVCREIKKFFRKNEKN